MPWTVKQTKLCPPSKPWGVFNQQTGRKVACHESEASARAQQKALYANVKEMSEESKFIFSEVQSFEEKDGLLRIHALPVRNYHTEFGEVDVSMDVLQRMVDNFYGKVRGQEIATDYDHGRDRAKGHKASGWIRDVAIEDNSLWLTVEPTPTAMSEIEDGEWKYFSLEWDDWADNDGTVHKDVIIGGGFTNRPVAKNTTPINFSELYVERSLADNAINGGTVDEDTTPKGESKEMEHSEPGSGSPPTPRTDEDGSDSKDIQTGSRRDTPPIAEDSVDNELDSKLREALGLSDDADIIKAVSDMKAEVEPLREAAKAMSERKKFAEQYPEEAAELERLKERNRDSEARLFAERYERFTKEDEDGKAVTSAFGLSALALEKIEATHKKFSEGTASVSDLAEVLDTIGEQGIVDYSERGSSRGHSNSDDIPTDADPGRLFAEKITEIQEEDKVGYDAAVGLAAKKHPKLFAEYRKVATGGREE